MIPNRQDFITVEYFLKLKENEHLGLRRQLSSLEYRLSGLKFFIINLGKMKADLLRKESSDNIFARKNRIEEGLGLASSMLYNTTREIEEINKKIVENDKFIGEIRLRYADSDKILIGYPLSQVNIFNNTNNINIQYNNNTFNVHPTAVPISNPFGFFSATDSDQYRNQAPSNIASTIQQPVVPTRVTQGSGPKLDSNGTTNKSLLNPS